MKEMKSEGSRRMGGAQVDHKLSMRRNFTPFELFHLS